MKKQIKQHKPFVSVVMPVYNAEEFVGQAIQSILAQTYLDFELIIVDDASSDRSYEIIKRYKRRYSQKVKIVRMKYNLNRGGDACANEGIKIAKGKYLARMDADDVAHPKRLAKQVAFLQAHPKVYLVGSNAYVINKKGSLVGEKKEPLSHQDIYHDYCVFHPIIHSSVMVRSVKGNKKFFYQLRYSANNDYYTFFKLMCEGEEFANLSEKLVFYRIHGKNDTFVKVKEKFLNTLKVRLTMVVAYGYEPSVKAIAATIVQSVLLFLLPQRASTKLYLFAKGIENPFRQLPVLARRISAYLF